MISIITRCNYVYCRFKIIVKIQQKIRKHLNIQINLHFGVIYNISKRNYVLFYFIIVLYPKKIVKSFLIKNLGSVARQSWRRTHRPATGSGTHTRARSPGSSDASCRTSGMSCRSTHRLTRTLVILRRSRTDSTRHDWRVVKVIIANRAFVKWAFVEHF